MKYEKCGSSHWCADFVPVTGEEKEGKYDWSKETPCPHGNRSWMYCALCVNEHFDKKYGVKEEKECKHEWVQEHKGAKVYCYHCKKEKPKVQLPEKLGNLVLHSELFETINAILDYLKAKDASK